MSYQICLVNVIISSFPTKISVTFVAITGWNNISGGFWSAILHVLFCIKQSFSIIGCSTADWKFAADQFVKMLPDKVIVHCNFHCCVIIQAVYMLFFPVGSQRNMYKLTLDGVDVMGERLAEEVSFSLT
ncbi:hypothetical protein BHE74_00014727 [Ensete ventricosum]|nr:hypothetical protein GW17_00009073 [Ensete ventricosum]RWW77133.1 hypothetical protein BHE74_00014727 [Ensete ventricosum]RZS13026.1 hypothetical protein BHM03_00044541 [Ensete ventricosum]